MRQLVSPKQVAQAIGVSESSLKRWCDRDLLKSVRTAGGHRRLEVETVLQFLRESGHGVVRPDLLGLPSTVGHGDTVVDRAREQLRDSLVAGDEEQCRRIIFDLYLAGQSATEICDRAVAGAFHDIGHGWECGQVVVYRERPPPARLLSRFSTSYGGRFLRLRIIRLPPSAERSKATLIACQPRWSNSRCTKLAGRQAPWARCFRSPRSSKRCAENQPNLLWISVSTIRSIPEFLDQYGRLQEVAARQGTAIAVGGRALTSDVRQQMTYSAYCDTLRHLVTFANSLKRPLSRRRSKAQ